MLHLTGLLFLTNAAHAAWKGQWLYCVAFLFLAQTTYLVHDGVYDNLALFWIDQVAMYLIIGIGAKYFWGQNLFIQILAGLCLIVVILLRQLREEGAHALIHLFSSAGHHYLLL